MNDDQHLREENEKLKAELARQALVISKLQHYLRGCFEDDTADLPKSSSATLRQINRSLPKSKPS